MLSAFTRLCQAWLCLVLACLLSAPFKRTVCLSAFEGRNDAGIGDADLMQNSRCFNPIWLVLKAYLNTTRNFSDGLSETLEISCR